MLRKEKMKEWIINNWNNYITIILVAFILVKELKQKNMYMRFMDWFKAQSQDLKIIIGYMILNLKTKFILIGLVFLVMIILIKIFRFFQIQNTELLYLSLGALIPIIISLIFNDAYDKYNQTKKDETINIEINKKLYKFIHFHCLLDLATNLSPIQVSNEEWSNWVKAKGLTKSEDKTIIEFYEEKLQNNEVNINVENIERLIENITKNKVELEDFLHIRLIGNSKKEFYLTYLKKLNTSIVNLKTILKHPHPDNIENNKIWLKSYFSGISDLLKKLDKIYSDYYNV